MLGDTAHDSRLLPLVDKFCAKVETVFEHSAPLMTFPPTIAQKYNLKLWQRFESSVTETLTLANAIIDFGLLSDNRSNGLIAKMLESGMSPEDIKRIFIDLIMAAGDTVHFNIIYLYTSIYKYSRLLLLFFVQTAFSSQWALYLLAKNVKVQNIVRSDVYSDLSNSESALIRGTVREALRLYPVATFIGRILPTDAVIENYEIPKYVKYFTVLFFLLIIITCYLLHFTDTCIGFTVYIWQR